MTDINEEEPLDPKVEAIRQKMVKLLMVSGGIMLVGLATVLIAIVYKINGDDAPRANADKPVAISLPTDAKLASVTADENGLTITLANPDRSVLVRRYDRDGNLLLTYLLSEQ